MAGQPAIVIDRMDWHPQAALAKLEDASRNAGETAGHHVLDTANRHVPYRSGELAASGEVRIEGDEVGVGYGAEHARYVHAHPEWKFESGRSGHWLEEALAEDASDISGIYADAIRSEWGGLGG